MDTRRCLGGGRSITLYERVLAEFVCLATAELGSPSRRQSGALPSPVNCEPYENARLRLSLSGPGLERPSSLACVRLAARLDALLEIKARGVLVARAPQAMPAPVVKLPTVDVLVPERGGVVGDRLRPPACGLVLLGEVPALGRAERLGRELDHPFELRPLTPEQLQWYIDVEAPSQAIGEGIDGMYVRLHISIDKQPDLFPERDRLVPLIKLIIDEGERHYERFRAV